MIPKELKYINVTKTWVTKGYGQSLQGDNDAQLNTKELSHITLSLQGEEFNVNARLTEAQARLLIEQLSSYLQ